MYAADRYKRGRITAEDDKRCLSENTGALYRGADKSLARPGREQATAIKL